MVRRALLTITPILAMCFLPGFALAQQLEQVVPAFAVDLPGAYESRWRSELRFYNGDAEPHAVLFERLIPFGNASCSIPAPLVVPPGQMRTILTLDCTGPSVVAIEFSADAAITTFSSVTNVGAASVQDGACCYSGFTHVIPVLRRNEAYATAHTLPNVPVPVDRQQAERHLARINHVFINPNPDAISISLTVFDQHGNPIARTAQHEVPAQSAIQINNAFPYPTGIPIPNQYKGLYRIEAASSDPFYTYVAVVDNATNDATFIGSVPPQTPTTFP
jgi:hypothetical protein